MIYQFMKNGVPMGRVSLYPQMAPMIDGGLWGVIARLPSSQTILPFVDPIGFGSLLAGLAAHHPIVIPGYGVISVQRHG